MRGELTRPATIAAGRAPGTPRSALAATSYFGVVVAPRLSVAGSTLQPVPASWVTLARHVPAPVSLGLLVAGTIALMGALRVRRRLGV